MNILYAGIIESKNYVASFTIIGNIDYLHWAIYDVTWYVWQRYFHTEFNWEIIVNDIDDFLAF